MTLQDYRVQTDAELSTRVVDYRNHREIEQLITHGWRYVGGQCWVTSSPESEESDSTGRKTFLPRLSESCICGDGLVLTYPVLEDITGLYANEFDDEVRCHSIFPPASSAALESRIVGAYAGWRLGDSTFLVGRRDFNGVALTTLSVRRLGPPGVLDVGYSTMSAYRGNGYAAHTLRLFTQWVFNASSVQRIELGIKPGNAASVSTALKAGYHLESVRRSRLRNADGSFDDEHSYVALKDDHIRAWRYQP
ncbi:GNAT family N-acetyltransferase [Brenneria rubrifaciens]|uniref:GNAT family N-acetyltransferase n=1 Tax=Brenneria rubrifaciens TaxID=55213 RepID=UPI00360CE704